MSNAIETQAVAGANHIQFSEERPVFERLGDIVRALHDTLTEIGANHVLSDAASEFPSARERLQHIGNLTEKAANTVLSKVEEHMPVQEKLGSTAEQLQKQWDQLASPSGEQFETLVLQTKAFLSQAQTDSAASYQALSEIMMAQDFQDLTGQLIKKVVSLIDRTENDLIRLLIDAAPPGTISIHKKDELMAGPGAAGGIALEQSSVDDLLADLGF